MLLLLVCLLAAPVASFWVDVMGCNLDPERADDEPYVYHHEPSVRRRNKAINVNEDDTVGDLKMLIANTPLNELREKERPAVTKSRLWLRKRNHWEIVPTELTDTMVLKTLLQANGCPKNYYDGYTAKPKPQNGCSFECLQSVDQAPVHMDTSPLECWGQQYWITMLPDAQGKFTVGALKKLMGRPKNALKLTGEPGWIDPNTPPTKWEIPLTDSTDLWTLFQSPLVLSKQFIPCNPFNEPVAWGCRLKCVDAVIAIGRRDEENDAPQQEDHEKATEGHQVQSFPLAAIALVVSIVALLLAVAAAVLGLLLLKRLKREKSVESFSMMVPSSPKA